MAVQPFHLFTNRLGWDNRVRAGRTRPLEKKEAAALGEAKHFQMGELQKERPTFRGLEAGFICRIGLIMGR